MTEILQYSPARRWAAASRVGDLLYLAGETGTDPETMQVVDGGIEAQTEQVFANIRSTLAHFGADLTDVIKVTIFLTDMADLDGHERRARAAPPDAAPSSAIGVVALAPPAHARRDRGDRRRPSAPRPADRPGDSRRHARPTRYASRRAHAAPATPPETRPR